MLKTLVIQIYVLLIIVVFSLTAWITSIRYQAVKKYYPEMTFWEYCIIGDKLRVTPQGD